jgi:hypothetical protein
VFNSFTVPGSVRGALPRAGTKGHGRAERQEADGAGKGPSQVEISEELLFQLDVPRRRIR